MITASYNVCGVSDRILISGDAQQSLRFDGAGFFKPLLTLPPRRCIDFLHIAAGLYVVDRITKRRKHDDDQGARQLHVSLRVRDAAFWRQAEVCDLVQSILTFLSGDDWLLEFSQLEPNPADSGYQDFLSLPRPFEPKIAALYSGGLDSAAGLANRILSGGNEFLLVTVAHQSGMHRRIRKQLRGVQGLREDREAARVVSLHSTLTLCLEGGKARRMRQQEPTQRTRAFLFCSCAAIAADAYKVSTIEMYENGVGAINLPLMSGMLGNGLATRGAHPTFLRLMSELATRVTAKPLQFLLPFADKTKTEMVRPLANVSGMSEWLQDSRSCVHTSLRHRGKTHCGCCPACIERRQAFACGGIQEDLGCYQADVFRQGPGDADYATYLYLYKREAKKWLERDARTWRRMSDHLHLTDVPTEEHVAIEQLQSRHSEEVIQAFVDPPQAMFERGSQCLRAISVAEHEVAP